MALHLAVDRDHDRIDMPLVAELRRAPTDLAGAGPGECLRTAPHGFIVDDDPAGRQQVRDHPQAERKADRALDSLLDDVRREPVTAINGCRTRHHRARRADARRYVVNLTGPLQLVRLAGAGRRKARLGARRGRAMEAHLLGLRPVARHRSPSLGVCAERHHMAAQRTPAAR